jgi:LmbE family N-acetylglucosaminyl deacetylase
MKPAASLALALLAATAFAQTSNPPPNQTPATSPTSDSAALFTDPANLRGERPRAHDGRELPIDQGVSGLQQLLRKLNTRASILNIVAHPDDEDGGMLTLYSRGLGARVADLSLTRGEGGQNAATGDFEDALGLLRTQELLASDRYPGIDQFFGTEVDFGFSKTKAEAFAKWTHERVLYDVVRAIRLYRPLVLTATFIGGVTDGHGQHQVSGEIAQEAFLAAGDPNVFPELTREGIFPWQPLKIYARVPMQAITSKGLFDYATGQYTEPKFTNYVTGEVSTTPPTTDIIVHEGSPDPLLTLSSANPADLSRASAADGSLSYVQFARIGLGLQKSQIGGNVRIPPPGPVDVSYHLYGSKLPASTSTAAASNPAPNGEPSFFDGIDTSIMGLQEYHTFPPDIIAVLARNIRYATEHFDPGQPQDIAPYLATALKTADDLIALTEGSDADPVEKASALHELRVKRVQLNDALALSLGITLDATANDENQIAEDPVSVWSQLKSKSTANLTIKKVWLTTARGEVPPRIAGREETPDLTSEHSSQITLTAAPAYTGTVTEPYFFRNDIEAPVYRLLRPELRNAPQTPPALVAHAMVSYKGVLIERNSIVHAGLQPISFVPLASIATVSHAQVLPNTAPSINVALTVNPSNTRVETDLPPHWKVTPDVQPKDAPSGSKQLRLEPPAGKRLPFTLTAVAIVSDRQEIKRGFRPVGYGDLPRTNFFTPATDRIVPVDLNLPTKKSIAYLPGTGDAVPEALASIGLTPTLLTISDLTPERLKQYDTVILGVRTYNAHPDLHGAPTQALLDYARNGGNVVVQYQTYEFTAADAPYPLALGSNEKVVDENAPVVLQPGPSAAGERLLAFPNKITPDDFNGWTEERGHGFLSTWDDHYSAPTETHDPGVPAEGILPQAPQRGGLITAQVGKGRWTYVAYALYRQLPEAVPGAFRLFVNLINP